MSTQAGWIVVCADGSRHVPFTAPEAEESARSWAKFFDKGTLLGAVCGPHEVQFVEATP